MSLLNKNALEVAGGLAAFAVLATAIIRFSRYKRLTEEEQERNRRRFLVQSGRMVDGMLLDICDIEGSDGATLTVLLFNYRVGGVDYECSQDITQIRSLVDEAQMRIGYPCTVRHQSGNPQNSIVIAEGWSGLRARLPQLPKFDVPEPSDKGRLKAG